MYSGLNVLYCEKPFKCDFCKGAFTWPSELLQHQNIHPKCKECQLTFTDNLRLKEHQRLRSTSAPLKCNNCTKTFCFHSDLAEHETGHFQNTLQGVRPNYRTTTIKSKNSADSSVNGNSSTLLLPKGADRCSKSLNSCTKCTDNGGSNKTTDNSSNSTNGCTRPTGSSPKSTKNHKSYYIHTKFRSCVVCGQNFKSLLDHWRYPGMEKPLVCEVCQKRPRLPQSQLGAALKCDLCNESFFLPSQLLQHQTAHHKCTDCHQSFIDHSHLQGHIQLRSINAPLRCNHCPRNFCSYSDLADHETGHFRKEMNFSPYLQQLIENSENSHTNSTDNGTMSTVNYIKSTAMYTKSTNSGTRSTVNSTKSADSGTNSTKVNERFRNSTGEPKPEAAIVLQSESSNKQFKCVVCQKSFMHSKHLKLHLTSHPGEKYLKCKVCEETFYWPSELLQHHKTHPKCSDCLQSFTDQSRLEDHLHMRSTKAPLRCTACEKLFCLHSDLAEHESIHFKTRLRDLKSKPYSRVLISYKNSRSVINDCNNSLNKGSTSSGSKSTDPCKKVSESGTNSTSDCDTSTKVCDDSGLSNTSGNNSKAGSVDHCSKWYKMPADEKVMEM